MAQMNIKVGVKNLKDNTNILDIKVPAKLKERKLTGIDFFDTALGGGGFVPSQVTMLTGTPGAGKTTMVMQLADSITRQGHICLFNTGEESLYQTAMVAERLKITKGFICGQDVFVDDLLTKADAMRKANPTKQVFVLQDSLPTLNDGFYKDGGTTGGTPIRVCEKLVNWAKDNYGIVMFINHVSKSGEFVGKNTVKHAIDTHVQLFIDEDKKSETYGERLLGVTKNRFGCAGKTMILGLGKAGLFEKGEISYSKE
jgi:DNA repair protein RadA/Sms